MMIPSMNLIKKKAHFYGKKLLKKHDAVENGRELNNNNEIINYI